MTSPSPHINRWRAFALLAVSFFMTIIDLTIVNVSLPTIGRDLHFTPTSLQWVVTAYALTFGGFLLLGGRAADLLGRRRMLMAGLVVFTGASLACALATGDQPDGGAGGAEATPDPECLVPLGALLEHVHHDRQGGGQHGRRAQALDRSRGNQKRVAGRERAGQ